MTRAKNMKPRLPRTWGKLPDIGAWALSVVALIAFWQWYVERFQVSPAVLPKPTAVWKSLVTNLGNGIFFSDLQITLYEVAVGFVIGCLLGFVLAILIAEFRYARAILYPNVIIAQSIPKAALAPMFLIWFGFGVESKIGLVIVSSFFPVLVNVLSGIERTDPDLLDMLKAYCGRRWRVFFKVKLPSTLPQLFAGLELAIVFSLISAIVSEFLGSTAGLGYRIMVFNTDLNMAGQFAALIVLSATGFVLHRFVKIASKYAIYWGNPRK